MSRFPWRVMFLLWGMAAFGIIAVAPYVLTLQGPMLQKTLAAKPLLLPFWVMLTLSFLQSLALTGGLATLGMWLARPMGMGAPILEAWLEGGESPGPRLRAIWRRSALIGGAAGVAVIVVDWLVFSHGMKAALLHAGIDPTSINPPWWQGLLASFYGGCAEELLTRLFLLTLLAWIGARLTRASGQPGASVLWIANVIAALIFGAGHLPGVKAMGLPVDAFMVTRTLVLNAGVGIAFGWLYVSVGLEAAMIAHFSADLVLHVLTPLFAGT